MDDGTSAASRAVLLRAISDDNRISVQDLRVADEQKGFVDGVVESLVEAAATPEANPWYRAVYAGDTPVGFVMLSDDAVPGDAPWPWRYYLWRMLIDARFQGRGYGRAALDLVVGYLTTRPGADLLVTSVVPGDGSPMGFYLRYGFRPTGEALGHEEVLQLRLADRVATS